MAAGTPSLTASVVIPTFNRRERVRECLDAILADPAASEVVVVIDGCRDGTLELLQEMQSEDARIRTLFVEHGGDGRAREAGVGVARGDVVVLVDDDVIAKSGLVAGHLAHHASREDLLVLGYMPTVVDRPRQPGRFATELYAREYEATTRRWEEDPDSILTSTWAGNLSIRRENALRVSLTAPASRIPYHEDLAFGLRCRDAGLTGVFDRDLVATHHHVRPLEAFIADARRQGQGALLVHQLHGEGPYAFEDEQPFPAPIRAVIRAAASTSLGRPVKALLRGAITFAGATHLYYVESYVAMLLRLAIQREAVIELDHDQARRAAPTSVSPVRDRHS